MTNGHCPETYETEKARKGVGRNRKPKDERTVHKTEQAVRAETPPVRDRETRRP